MSFYKLIPDIFVLVSLGSLSFFLLLRHFTLISLAEKRDFDKVSRLRVSNLAIAVFLLSICMIFLFLRLLVLSRHFADGGFTALGAFAIFGLAVFFNAGVLYIGLRRVIKRKSER